MFFGLRAHNRGMDRRPSYGSYLPAAFAVGVVGVFIPWVAKGYAATQSVLVPTFFPWWTQLLVVAGPLLAWWRIRPGRTDAQRRASLGSLTLLSMHLIGFGSVALRHSGPYCGQQGCVAQELLTLAAALVSLAGVLSLALCLGEALLARSRRTASNGPLLGAALMVCALLLVVITPALAVELSAGWSTTALGSALLVFGGPWGLGLGLAAWLDRADFTRGVLLTLGLVAGAAMIGPVHALYPDSTGASLLWVFAPGLAVAIVLRMLVRRESAS